MTVEESWEKVPTERKEYLRGILERGLRPGDLEYYAEHFNLSNARAYNEIVDGKEFLKL